VAIIYLFLYPQRWNPQLETVISEANSFVNAFAYPISQSMPHIYLSALPFSPSESATLQSMRDAFQNTLSVEAGRSKEWPVIHQTLVGHSSGVRSVAFSPDSTRIVSGSYDQTIRIWDAVSGTPIGEPLQGHLGWIESVSFSRDGSRIVSGSGAQIQIWDVASGAPVGEPLRGHCNEVNSVAFSLDGTRIISGSGDQTVRIWNAVTGASVGEPHPLGLCRLHGANMERHVGCTDWGASARTL